MSDQLDYKQLKGVPNRYGNSIMNGVVNTSDYTFNAAAKTITFSTKYAGIQLSEIMYIVNVKADVATVIYDPGILTKGGTLMGLVLTLVYDTSAMSNTDTLQIIVSMQDDTVKEDFSSRELSEQILQELKVISHYISELPRALATDNVIFDDPEKIRDEDL